MRRRALCRRCGKVYLHVSRGAGACRSVLNVGAGDVGTGDFWLNIIESLSTYPPPLVHDLIPKMRRCWKAGVIHNNFEMDVSSLQQQAKLVLTFYLHKLEELAVRYPITYLSKFAKRCTCTGLTSA